jgi:hypothetical protein
MDTGPHKSEFIDGKTELINIREDSSNFLVVR